MGVSHPNLSPCDRMLARRRRTFIRDWILVLIALGLAMGAGVFHPGRGPSGHGPPAHAAAFAR
jgi:hypothetical protein